MVGLRRSQRCSVGDSWWSQAATSCVLLVGLQATAEQLFIRLQTASHAQSSRTYRAAPMQVDSTVGHPSEPCCMLALALSCKFAVGVFSTPGEHQACSAAVHAKKVWL